MVTNSPHTQHTHTPGVLPYLPLDCRLIWLWGVEAGVGGFRSTGISVMELLPVDWGVWGPCREPELAGGGEEGEEGETV